jgi:Ca2+-binding RTX toxin-like protein
MPITLSTGNLINSVLTTDFNPRALAQVYSVDLNLDGNSDLLILSASYPFHGEPEVQQGLLAFGDGNGGFNLATEDQFPLSTLKTVHPREAIFEDLNSDGVPDIFIASHGFDASPFPGEQNLLFLSNANMSWSNATSSLTQATDFSHSASAGDVNGDGHLDVIVGNVPQPNPEHPYLMINNGAGEFSSDLSLIPIESGGSLNQFQTRITSSLLYDLDDDGLSDFVAGSFNSTGRSKKPAFVLWNTQGRFDDSQRTILPHPTHLATTHSTYEIQPLDINHDGLQDLLIAYQNSVSLGGWELQILINEGGRQFSDQTEIYLPAESDQWGGLPKSESPESQYWIQFLRISDLNNDGRLDFALDARGITSAPSNLPVVYLQKPDNSFESATVSEVAGEFTWIFDYTTQPITFGGQTGFAKIGLQDDTLTIYTLPVTYEPFLPIFTGFSNPVVRWGTSGDDTLHGGNGNDTFHPNTGNDSLHGWGGLDTARFNLAYDEYQIIKTDLGFSVANDTSGTNNLEGIERLQFSDTSIALDLDGNAGAVAKILGAVFGAESIANPEYVGIGLQELDRGMSFSTLSQLAISARLGSNASYQEIIGLLYSNIVGLEPSNEEIAPYIELLDNGTLTVGDLGMLAADTTQNTTNINLVGLAAMGLEFLVS